jgi:CPA1 family monovalent cation:H+ antiporter
LDRPLVFFSIVLGLGTLAQWLAWRLRLPSILVLLIVGFGVGYLCGDNPAVPGETISDEVITQRLLFPLVSMSVGVIMFEGSLTLRFNELPAAGSIILRLVTIGAAVTWSLGALFAYTLVEMDARVAALTGAILVVTGPTVIGPLLRHVRPQRRVGSVLKWEGIVIDPIGAVLALLVFDALFLHLGGSIPGLLVKIILIGVTLGLSAAYVMMLVIHRYWIPDFLHNPAFLAVALGMFALSNVLVPEAGLLTVTIMGIALANQKRIPVRHVLEFKENLRVLLISCLFIVLGARIRAEDLSSLGWGGLAFVAALILVVRPLSVFLATLGSEMSWQERTFLATLAPRGIVAAAVSSVFALEVMKYGTGDLPTGHDKIAPLTFLVIIVTVAVYGLAASPLAQVLKLAIANPQGILFVGAAVWVRRIAKSLHEEGIPVLLVDTNYRNIAAAGMEGLPAQCMSIVAEAMEEIDLAGIGRLMATTPNDDLNTLSAVEFAPLFGRANVYQLAYRETAAARRSSGATHLSGRYPFDKEATYSKLSDRFAAGAVVKKTKISDEFTYEDFNARYGESALLLFVINEARQLLISPAEEPLKPRPGQTIIALVD